MSRMKASVVNGAGRANAQPTSRSTPPISGLDRAALLDVYR